jgi:hypothetical protein
MGRKWALFVSLSTITHMAIVSLVLLVDQRQNPYQIDLISTLAL